MIRKPLDLPPEVARAFVKDMRAYWAETSDTKRGEIAVRQMNILNEYLPPRSKKLRLSDVKAMFSQMRDEMK